MVIGCINMDVQEAMFTSQVDLVSHVPVSLLGSIALIFMITHVAHVHAQVIIKYQELVLVLDMVVLVID
jgi:hypothetical protein